MKEKRHLLYRHPRISCRHKSQTCWVFCCLQL